MFRVVLIILIYIVAPAWILLWAVRRYRTGVKPNLTETLAVIFAIIMISFLMYQFSGPVTDRDNKQLHTIVSSLTASYRFPLKAKYENRPAVNGVAHPRYLEIRIYGVTSKEGQDKVVMLLKKLRREVASKPIVVNFFSKEIWLEKPDGSRWPERDKEQPIQTVRLQKGKNFHLAVSPLRKSC